MEMTLTHINKVYDKFSNNLLKKLKELVITEKDKKAIEIINQIFVNEK